VNEVSDNSNLLKSKIQARGMTSVAGTDPLFRSGMNSWAKDAAIHDVVRNALDTIEGQTTNFGDEMHAISKAAASGAVSREMHDLSGTPDFEVHHSTVVDHRM
jgi:hypothetical protein